VKKIILENVTYVVSLVLVMFVGNVFQKEKEGIFQEYILQEKIEIKKLRGRKNDYK